MNGGGGRESEAAFSSWLDKKTVFLEQWRDGTCSPIYSERLSHNGSLGILQGLGMNSDASQSAEAKHTKTA